MELITLATVLCIISVHIISKNSLFKFPVLVNQVYYNYIKHYCETPTSTGVAIPESLLRLFLLTGNRWEAATVWLTSPSRPFPARYMQDSRSNDRIYKDRDTNETN